MKKSAFYLLTCILLFVLQPQYSFSATQATALPKTVASPQPAVLLQRLNDLNAMDKSGLTRLEKTKMQTELRSIRDQLRVMNGGIYLSAGAIIIILLILIIVF
jgi:hypothetical protein